jgi:Topoisomerase IA
MISRKNQMKILLTEKKDQAEKLAKTMGWRQGKGCFEGKFEGDSIKVVWARGHLVTLKNPDEVVEGLPWDDPSKLLPIPQLFPIKIGDDIKGAPPAAQPKAYLDNIKYHMKEGVSEFIIATDSDREGEAIGWYVLLYLGYTGPVRRAWFSAGLDEKSLREAMSNLRPSSFTKSWYRAAEARGRSDWAYMFLVRAYTHYASYSVFGSNLGQGSGRSRVMSVGRVQTPALAIIVRRDIEIENFISKDHFKISGLFSAIGSSNSLEAAYSPLVTAEIIEQQPTGVTWEPSKIVGKDGEPDPLDTPLFTDKTIVDSFKSRLMAAKNNAKVFSYKEGFRKENPPKTFSLIDAQAAIAKECKISANLAQTILEDLYEQGWTSYARTSKSDLPINFYEPSERNGLLSSLLKLPETQSQARIAMDIHNGTHAKYTKFTPSVFTNKQLEHHGIVPTHQVMTPSEFSGLAPAKKDNDGKIKHKSEHMQAAYLIVVKQFIQALYPAAEYATQDVVFTVPVKDLLGYSDSIFKAKGERITEPGWRTAFSENAEKDSTFPSVKTGELVTLNNIETRAAQTKPPVRYTEITYPKALENVGKEVKDPQLRKRLKDSEGIGTPATRKTIIETLIAREYIEIKKSVFYSTKKGRDLVNVVPKWMSSPETTALWEDYLVKMCEQKDDSIAIRMRDDFVGKQIDQLEKLIRELMSAYNGNLGAKIQATPKIVSQKMKDAIKLIAEKKKISIPTGALSDPAKAKLFLETHMTKRGDGPLDTTPSEGQVKFVQSLISSLPAGTLVPENVLTDRKACSDFIEKSKKFAAPSAGQIEFAKKLIAKLPPGISAPDGVLTSGLICSSFIEEQTKDWKSKGSATKSNGSSSKASAQQKPKVKQKEKQ